MKYALLIPCALLFNSGWAQKGLLFSDKVYEPQIKTVQLYPDRGGLLDYQSAAVVPFGESTLVVEFDDLQTNRNNYYAKVMHCNYDWTKSTLMDLDYMNEYNEYPINDYAFSSSTQSPYVHYRFQIPPVKITGNYVLVVYRNDMSDLILSKRFMVYTNQVSLQRDNQVTGALSFTSQPINFVIDYGQIEIPNPMESVHLIMRQNQRWDNAKMDVRPSFLRDADNQLEYHFFDAEKFFVGGNEFRFVDFRSLNYPGQNTGKLNRTVKPAQLTVQQDMPRSGQPYTQYKDSNGGYQIDNQDTGEPKTNANYVNVTFSLALPDAIKDSVFVIGAFNSWDRNAENVMTYSPDKAAYEATILLKQGLYNYQFVADSRKLPENYFEGNHFETENSYEILVYNRDFQRNIDMIIGYFVIPVNPR